MRKLTTALLAGLVIATGASAALAAEIAEREAAITHLEAAAPERTEALRREIDVLSALADQPT